MDNEHARAKDAYGKIEKAVAVRIKTSDVANVPAGASSLLWLEKGELVCRRCIPEEEMTRFKKLGPEDPWGTALDKVNALYSKKGSGFADLKTWALKVPSMLQNEGLLQTAAVLQEKFNGKAADGKNVYWLLSAWLLGRVPWPNGVTKNDLMAALNALGDQEVFRFAHREAIAYMTWVKRAVSVNLSGAGQGG